MTVDLSPELLGLVSTRGNHEPLATGSLFCFRLAGVFAQNCMPSTLNTHTQTRTHAHTHTPLPQHIPQHRQNGLSLKTCRHAHLTSLLFSRSGARPPAALEQDADHPRGRACPGDDRKPYADWGCALKLGYLVLTRSDAAAPPIRCASVLSSLRGAIGVGLEWIQPFPKGSVLHLRAIGVFAEIGSFGTEEGLILVESIGCDWEDWDRLVLEIWICQPGGYPKRVINW